MWYVLSHITIAANLVQDLWLPIELAYWREQKRVVKIMLERGATPIPHPYMFSSQHLDYERNFLSLLPRSIRKEARVIRDFDAVCELIRCKVALPFQRSRANCRAFLAALAIMAAAAQDLCIISSHSTDRHQHQSKRQLLTSIRHLPLEMVEHILFFKLECRGVGPLLGAAAHARAYLEFHGPCGLLYGEVRRGVVARHPAGGRESFGERSCLK